MKFTVKKSVLSNALDKIAECLPKVALSFYNNVFIEAKDGVVKFGATNTKLGIWVTVNLVDIKEEGSEMISSEELLKISKINQDDDITIETKGSVYTISTEESVWSFPSVEKSAESLFGAIEIDEEKAITVKKQDFIDGLQRISYAICQDESRINLNVVSIGGDRMIATDGYRVQTVKLESKMPKVLLPEYAIRNLIKILKLSNGEDVQIQVGKSFVILKVLEDIMSIRLLSCEFPDIEGVVKETANNANILKTSVSKLTAVCKAAKINISMDNAVKLKLSSGKGEVTASNYKGKAFKAVIKPYSWNGGDLDIMLNCDYLLDALNGFKEKEVEIKFGVDSAKPIRIDDKDAVAIILPMRSL
ncbi:MAG: DNA polymerase III subunit beta [Candidatus Woesebacteria bacterium]|nr:DNA polymerase III subunit beta [Candidatus Woesebacteria bacterium]